VPLALTANALPIMRAIQQGGIETPAEVAEALPLTSAAPAPPAAVNGRASKSPACWRAGLLF
jgi:hypothetical protein